MPTHLAIGSAACACVYMDAATVLYVVGSVRNACSIQTSQTPYQNLTRLTRINGSQSHRARDFRLPE